MKKHYKDKISKLQEENRTLKKLLSELNEDFKTQEHSYIGRDSEYHKRIQETLKEIEDV